MDDVVLVRTIHWCVDCDGRQVCGETTFVWRFGDNFASKCRIELKPRPKDEENSRGVVIVVVRQERANGTAQAILVFEE
jgi:hypothetical protein